MKGICARGGREIVTGAQYERQITASAGDREARSAFHALVLRLAPPGGALLDFGAGTGMDARYYAERGFTVAAYDVDARMCGYFAGHCRDLLESGRVTLDNRAYREFLAGENTGDIDLVTANFAPLNLIGDLRELFAKFHALTGPDGRVLASVLSPYYLGDLRYGWWWRNSLRLWREGHFSVQGAQAAIVRRRLADFAAQSAPYFALRRVFRGLPAAGRQGVDGIDVRAGAGFAAVRMSTCRFMFLLFEKRPLP